jgi:membrane-associated protease RseP (regulator of RpoE activity)
LDQPQNQNHADKVTPAEGANAEPRGADAALPAYAAPPLTPAAWLANNAIYLLILGLIVGGIWYKLGLDGVWVAAKVVVGIGFLIFIHELGHFLAAKWCDVHVQTFSVGFGPALPGCSFQRGETTYKLAVLPLGGYVNMVGEGLEADEDESYPRSFKNKTVGQRMLIISAGVIMNVLLGCVLFIAVYYYHGVEQPPAIVGLVDAGSPMWEKGVPVGSSITDLDGIKNPVFKNLRVKVILSKHGEKLPFTFQMYGPDGEKQDQRTVDLLPRREENDLNPVVGVSPPNQLRLPPRPRKDLGQLPVSRNSVAAAARPIPLEANEVIVAATDPDNPEQVKPITNDPKAGTFDYMDLSKRLRSLEGKKLVIHVLPRGADKTAEPVARDVPLEGFQFNDTIIGCTDAQDTKKGSYNPFRVSELPSDPRHPEGDHRDPFIFLYRLRQLAGLPMVVQVRRGDANSSSLRDLSTTGPTVNLYVPPAFHVTFGMRMKMGKVAALREDSPAARAGIRKGDELIKMVMKDERGDTLRAWEELDPERLPFELRTVAASKPGKKTVALTVRRDSSAPNHAPENHTLPAVEWEDRWDGDEEVPLSTSSPLPIPQLGVAYWVLSQIVEVKDGSPAAMAHLEKDGSSAPLKKDDTIKEARIRQLSLYSKELDWSGWAKMESERNGNTVYDRWAHMYWVTQLNDYKEMQVRVNRPGEEMKEDITLVGREDLDWPLASRGILLMPDYKVQKASNFGEALVLGGRESTQMIWIMLQQLRSLLTGRISVKQTGGPIAMVSQGFSFAQAGNFELLLFLGMISINLAVVNFLPIPILDGGHMVFLIYEKLRGRPPAEKIRAVATYIGLATIGLLMILVFYQDFQNYVRKMFNI